MLGLKKHKKTSVKISQKFQSEASGIRTPDNLIKSQVLYQLSSCSILFNYHFQSECPEPESNQRHEDFQSSALPTELSGQNSGDRIWTYDLRVMSPTSFQTAPPRDINF